MSHQQGAAQVHKMGRCVLIVLRKKWNSSNEVNSSLNNDTLWSWKQPSECWTFNLNIFCVPQILQWLIVHADTIQSLLRCRELSLGGLQELSLLTGIISKTALPGTIVNRFLLSILYYFSLKDTEFNIFIVGVFMDHLVFQVFLKWAERSTALLVWSFRVTYTDSRFDGHSCFYYMWYMDIDICNS